MVAIELTRCVPTRLSESSKNVVLTTYTGCEYVSFLYFNTSANVLLALFLPAILALSQNNTRSVDLPSNLCLTPFLNLYAFNVSYIAVSTSLYFIQLPSSVGTNNSSLLLGFLPRSPRICANPSPL